MFDDEKVLRIDYVVTEALKNSDGEVLNEQNVANLTAMFNTDDISSDEVNDMINSGRPLNDERIVVMTTADADKFKSILKAEELE